MKLPLRSTVTAVLILLVLPAIALGWGGQGHRLIAMIATDHLTPVARQNVRALLGEESLADVASWPDAYRPLETQTAAWHYVSIPGDAAAYDRDRDCPPQPGVTLGAPNDRWRDCAVDRILFFEDRLADTTLDTADRATALKYLVHFIGDLHQPFHAYGPEKGANGISVVEFGSVTCGTHPCNLHAVWDSGLLDHRHLSDSDYLARLESQIVHDKIQPTPEDPAVWANESHAAALKVVLPQNGAVDEAYFNQDIPVAEARMETAGLRLAAVLNRIFTAPPVPFQPKPAPAQ